MFGMIRAKPAIDIEVGAVFRTASIGGIPATACVLGLCRDLSGIPHVRFRFRQESAVPVEDLRTLALSSFSARFAERVRA